MPVLKADVNKTSFVESRTLKHAIFQVPNKRRRFLATRAFPFTNLVPSHSYISNFSPKLHNDVFGGFLFSHCSIEIANKRIRTKERPLYQWLLVKFRLLQGCRNHIQLQNQRLLQGMFLLFRAPLSRQFFKDGLSLNLCLVRSLLWSTPPKGFLARYFMIGSTTFM